MALKLKKRVVVAGAVLGASLFTLAVANAQIDPTTGAPTTPGIPQTPPGLPPQPGVSPPPGSVPPTTPSPYGSQDGGFGGSGYEPTYPSPFDTMDAGFGGGGLMPPPVLAPLDAGLR